MLHVRLIETTPGQANLASIADRDLEDVSPTVRAGKTLGDAAGNTKGAPEQLLIVCNQDLFDAFVKMSNQGGYSFPYSFKPAKAAKTHVANEQFNPDFFLKVAGQRVILVVEYTRYFIRQGPAILSRRKPLRRRHPLTDNSGRMFDVSAEDVRQVAGMTFIQVVFRLPDGLAEGACTVRLTAHAHVSNTGIIRISAP